jgi:hypothetical protein
VATGDEPQPEQRFGHVLVSARVEEHPALLTLMSSTASELMNLIYCGYSGD